MEADLELEREQDGEADDEGEVDHEAEEQPEESSAYADEYSEEAFWEKLKRFAVRAGKEIVEKVLTLYYCLKDPDTPAWAKAQIIAALGYFISPLDAIPDVIPGAGYADDLGVLVLALAAVAAHIKPEHVKRAVEQMRTWFRRTPDPEGDPPDPPSGPAVAASSPK